MALDERKCAEEIYRHLGGRDNIISAAHCATRLRLAIADMSRVDLSALEQVEGVQGVYSANGQLQCIIGPGTVNHVYDEFLKITGLNPADQKDVKAAAAARQPLLMRMVKTLGDVFVPILPAIVASGLLMGIVEASGKAIPGFESTAWYGFLDLAANTAFTYLPVLVAVSSARVFGGNLFLGAVIGLMMVHPSLLNGWNVGNKQAINAFFGVKNGVIPTWDLFGHVKIGSYVLGSVRRSGYQGHVIPIMIAVWFMSRLEKKLHEIVPAVIDLFVTPLTTVLLTALLAFVVVGPIFSVLETYMLKGAQFLITVGFGIGAGIMGMIYPVSVVMGLHHMYNVIEAGLLSSAAFHHLNIWMPIASAANFAQFGACLAVAVKTRDQKMKSIAFPSALSAALGITEPAIFGVNLRQVKPFVCGMIGGGVGAWFGSFAGLGATAYGVTGIPGYLIINHPLLYSMELLIAAGVAFILTIAIYHEKEEKVLFETAHGDVLMPVKGKIIAANQIADPTFASEKMGPTLGIIPAADEIYAPFDGQVTMVFPTKHALGLMSDTGIELLIHVGIDTVKRQGDGFEVKVAAGDQIAAGQLLMRFDRRKMKAAGYQDTVIVVITNQDAGGKTKKAVA